MTTTTTNTAIESNIEFLDELVNELVNEQMKPLKQRIGDNTIDLNNYLKYPGGKGRKTGNALLLNKISHLSVIDIDINKNYNDEQREKVYNDVINSLSDDDIIVKTASGGIHIYCNTDVFPASSNRMVKCFTSDDFDVDIFSTVDESKQSLVVLPGSRVRKNAKEQINRYEFVQGDIDSVITRSIDDVINDLGIKIKIEQPREIQKIINDNKERNIDLELAQALVNGICDLEIHNDGGGRKIEEEITLFTLFQAINSLPTTALIAEAYGNAFNECKLTDNARLNFETARARYSHLSTSPFVLAKIIKIYQNDYYNECIKPLIGHKFELQKIDFKDTFLITDVRSKAENNEYKNLNEVASDLSRIIRVIDNGTLIFVQKTYDESNDMYKFKYVYDKDMTRSLKLIKLWKDGTEQITAFNALQRYMSKFAIKGVKFIGDDENKTVSIFNGYKYNVLDSVNNEVINGFIEFVREVIADNDETVFNYIIHWFAFIVQHPGVKSEVALVLKGLQGIGKNRFTDILCELLAGYSEKNVTDISHITGRFNSALEHKMLVILNELKNCGEDRLANFDSLKSLITDDKFRINEKNEPMRVAENVNNFIFVSNNAYPVKIENSDRRYVVLKCNDKYKGNFDYFGKLVERCDKEFYDNLLTYFMKLDLSTFNVRLIPQTEAKQDLIEASRSPFDIWICDHYNQLIEGIRCSDALLIKPTEMKDKHFQLQIKERCERTRKSIDGKQIWHYVLKEGCKSIYKQTINEDDEE